MLRGRFGPAEVATRSIASMNERVLWQDARLVLPLSALESIRRIECFVLDGQKLDTAGDTFAQQSALAGQLSLDATAMDRATLLERHTAHRLADAGR